MNLTQTSPILTQKINFCILSLRFGLGNEKEKTIESVKILCELINQGLRHWGVKIKLYSLETQGQYFLMSVPHIKKISTDIYVSFTTFK